MSTSPNEHPDQFGRPLASYIPGADTMPQHSDEWLEKFVFSMNTSNNGSQKWAYGDGGSLRLALESEMPQELLRFDFMRRAGLLKLNLDLAFLMPEEHRGAGTFRPYSRVCMYSGELPKYLRLTMFARTQFAREIGDSRVLAITLLVIRAMLDRYFRKHRLGDWPYELRNADVAVAERLYDMPPPWLLRQPVD